MTDTEQVLCGDPAEAGTYECVDCANRVTLTTGTESMSVCECDEGHHKSHAWKRVDPVSRPADVTGEPPPEAAG